MADNSQRPDIGEGGSSRGQSSDALLQWLAQVAHIDLARLQTVTDAEGHLTLVRRQTDEELTTRRDESDTLVENRLRGTEEQLALMDRLAELQQAQLDQLREFDRLTGVEQQAFTEIDRQQDASIALMNQIEAQREAVDGYEVELESLFTALDDRWTEVSAALEAQGIAMGEVGETRDLGRLRTLIAEQRGALGREFDDLARRTEQARAEEGRARRENEEATARSEALQREIEVLGIPSDDPQDPEHTAAIAARIETLEAQRSEADAEVETSRGVLDRIATELAVLETQTERANRNIDALNNLAEGESSLINSLQSNTDKYQSTLKLSIRANDNINDLELTIIEANEKIKAHKQNIDIIRNNISENQMQISEIESEILDNKSKDNKISQRNSEIDQRMKEIDKKINQLLQTAERLDSDALFRAIQKLPESLQDDEITTAPLTTQPQEPDVEGEIAPDLGETRQRIEQLVVEAEEAGAEGMGAAASASMLRAGRDIAKILLRDAAFLATFATVRESSAYGIGASSDKTQQDLAALLIGLNFLPIAVKAGGLIYDTSASRPEADRLVPTAKQYASLVTNTLMMIGATVAADRAGGGVAAQAPAAARALIIGLRDMANLFMPVTQNRRGDLLLNMRAVLGDNVAYSLYSQLTTILIAQGLVHSGAGSQAAGLAGMEAVREVGKYVAAYTAVELLETISYRAFNQYFDRIAQGLEPAMPGDPNASQGVQGIARFRAKVGFKLKHTFAEVRRQGTDVAHARQAFTYIVLLLGNVVSELTKDRSVKSQTLILAGAMFVATFAAYFPFVGLSEYAAPLARDRDEEAGNE